MSDSKRSWLRLGERALRTGAYWMIAAAGFASLIWTPVTIQAVLGATMVTIWSILLMVGGLGAAIASTFEHWLAEIPAIPIILAGLAIYLVALWSLTAAGEVTRLAQACAITAYALSLGARWAYLKTLDRAMRPTD